MSTVLCNERSALLVRIAGQELELHAGGEIVIGRHATADIVVDNAHVSRRHAALRLSRMGTWTLEDLQSAGGVHVDGRRLSVLTVDRTLDVWLGRPHEGELLQLVVRALSPAGEPTLLPGGIAPPCIRIGRAPENDLVVDDLMASRSHAEVRRTRSGRLGIIDLESHNGTYVNGSRVTRAELTDGDAVGVGRKTFTVAGETLVELGRATSVAIEVEAVSVCTPDGRTALTDVTFHAKAGSLTAIIGPTGCGKSTLLRAMTGAVPAEGRVLYGGRDFFARFEELRCDVGLVPQDDVLHADLRLRDALLFAAELRFPADTSVADRAAGVDEVMASLGLAGRANVRIGKLSGGQRKRTNMALELLSRPQVLLLDEPTSGLDPACEKSVMELLVRLAANGTTVVVVTHSLDQLHMCDQVVALSESGRVAFVGPPAGLLPHFGRTDYADLFADLQRDPVPFTRPWTMGVRTPAPAPAPRRLQPRRRQLWTLVRRQLALLLADRRNLLFAAMAVLVPGLALLALVPRGVMDSATGPHREAFLLVAALTVAGCVVGFANSVRELVKERAIYARERAAGLSISAYVGSKVLVHGGITVVQCLALVRIATLSAAGPDASLILPIPWLELALTVAMAALAALALGLVVSAVVSTSEKANALIAVVFMVQWLFSGTAVSLQGKAPLQAIGYLTAANWGFAASSASTEVVSVSGRCDRSELLERLGMALPLDCDPRWHASVAGWLSSVLVLLVLMAASLALTALVLRRRDRLATAGKRSRVRR